MNIGQVLDVLRTEFPTITIPKIRFLEDKGLIKPERTPSGYRKFAAVDVDRLRYVLTMQRDHYLPLKVIGEHLEAIDRGLEPPPIEPVVPTVPTVALTADGMPSAESFSRRDSLRLSRRELIKIAEISEELLEQLEQFGLITSRTGTGHYDTDALVIAQTASELAGFGFEPRHLRAFRAAADREVGLVEQVIAPLKNGRDAAARARADDTVSEMAALSVRLHATLVKAGLRRSTDRGGPRPGRPRALRENRPARADPRHGPGGRVRECAKSMSWESGSRCPRTSRSCCCARSRGSGTCRSGSARWRPPRSPSPSRASSPAPADARPDEGRARGDRQRR